MHPWSVIVRTALKNIGFLAVFPGRNRLYRQTL